MWGRIWPGGPELGRKSAGRPISRVLSRANSAAAVISLAGRLPGRSSGLPESHDGPDQPCSLIWPCSRWGLPSQPVARLLVGSYPAFSPLPQLVRSQWSVVSSKKSTALLATGYGLLTTDFLRRYSFCCTFPILHQPLAADSDGGRYPPPCPVEPGLSSPRSPDRFTEANRSAFRAATVRPACGSTFIILFQLRTIHQKSVVSQ